MNELTIFILKTARIYQNIPTLTLKPKHSQQAMSN